MEETPSPEAELGGCPGHGCLQTPGTLPTVPSVHTWDPDPLPSELRLPCAQTFTAGPQDEPEPGSLGPRAAPLPPLAF